jgi:hypothetical protein
MHSTHSQPWPSNKQYGAAGWHPSPPGAQATHWFWKQAGVVGVAMQSVSVKHCTQVPGYEHTGVLPAHVPWHVPWVAQHPG